MQEQNKQKLEKGLSNDIELDCCKLITLACQLENDRFHFGHPPKPELKMYSFAEWRIFVLIAITPHYVCLQVIIDADSRNSEPRVLLSLSDDESSSIITASCIVELRTIETSTRHLLIVVGTSSSSGNNNSTVQNNSNRNSSNVHAATVKISTTGFTRIPPWQPLPPRKGFMDSKDVTSILSYDVHNVTYVWIAFDDGTILRLPAEAMAQDYSGPIDTASVLKVKTLLPTPRDATYKIFPCRACPSMWMLSKPREDYFSAIVFSSSSTSIGLGDPPTLVVYTSTFETSDNHDSYHEMERAESELLNVAIGATAKLFRGVSNAVQWGISRPNKASETDSDDEWDTTSCRFPTIYQPETIQLTAAYEIHDAPRQILDLKVHNDYAIITDNLGRVQLMHLKNHFQLTRMWKGLRDAVCAWASENLVLYSKQRRSLEVYPLPHGKRILSRQLSQNADLVQCHSSGGIQSCWILAGDEGESPYLLKELLITPDSSLSAEEAHLAVTSPSASVSSNDAKTQSLFSTLSAADTSMLLPAKNVTLQSLKQMLDNTNVKCTKEDVFLTFSKIPNLQQLSIALDLLCVSFSLEERMNARGADFQEQCVNHCLSVLEQIIKGNGADVAESQPVVDLKSKITTHAQLIDAYRILHQFETGPQYESDDDTHVNPTSKWAIEGLSWIQTYESVTQSRLSLEATAKDPISFSNFCRCCNIEASCKTGSSGSYQIHLSDSSKTRMDLLGRMFQPLLRDTFTYSVVNDIVDRLALDFQTSQQYFGEWFMSISPSQAVLKSFCILQPPILRWVQSLASKQVDACIDSNEELPRILLPELYSFCFQADDLVRSFLLACVCRESISTVVKKREVKTYGKVWKSQAVEPWDELLRKIRVCLFLSLRLYGVPLGPIPITVKHIESGDIFSIFELVARDEIASTCKHDEIVSLELACRNSGLSFDPASSLADDPLRWKALQRSCTVNTFSEEEQTEFLVDMDTDIQGALLLYLSQFNEPMTLCAHRALLLAQKWIEEPHRLEYLRDCLDALSALVGDVRSEAIYQEVWQSCIRPVFRAFLFGFDDIHEIQHEIYLPLMEKSDWLERMCKMGLSILLMIERSKASPVTQSEQASLESESRWPKVTKDFLLERYVEKSQPIYPRSVYVHRVMLTGILVSTNVSALSECVDGFYESFQSLQEPRYTEDGNLEMEMNFLESAIVSRAEKVDRILYDRFDIDEIESLAILWSIDVRDVRTVFVIAMCELGKDMYVKDVLSRISSTREMDFTRFVEDGIGLVCRRLHHLLHKTRSLERRAFLSILDADTTEWIRSTAEGSVSLLEDDYGDRSVMDVPLQLTHQLVIRLLSMAATNSDKELRSKLHSLSILTGTLLKQMENK